jgi:hypothetical protein
LVCELRFKSGTSLSKKQECQSLDHDIWSPGTQHEFITIRMVIIASRINFRICDIINVAYRYVFTYGQNNKLFSVIGQKVIVCYYVTSHVEILSVREMFNRFS